jgi:hypothetical protein
VEMLLESAGVVSMRGYGAQVISTFSGPKLFLCVPEIFVLLVIDALPKVDCQTS